MEEFAAKHQGGWIYERDGDKIYRRRVGHSERELINNVGNDEEKKN